MDQVTEHKQWGRGVGPDQLYKGRVCQKLMYMRCLQVLRNTVACTNLSRTSKEEER